MRHLPLFDPPEIRLPLLKIREEIGDCHRCPLSACRRNIVFGQGNEKARVMLIGEAPGETEDGNGLAFTGRGGNLLAELLESVGSSRGEVYIANCVKCRPPGNRKPEEPELTACRPFLQKQILSVNPKVIVALGGYAASWLTGNKVSIMKIRGKVTFYKGIQVVPTYHPAYVLRNPADQAKLVLDLHLAMELAR